MRKRAENTEAKSNPSGNLETSNSKRTQINDNKQIVAKRSTYAVLALFVLAMNGAWAVYHYQFETLPPPLSLEHVGKRGFSEYEAMMHVKALTQFGPHPVGSSALERAVQVLIVYFYCSHSVQKICLSSPFWHVMIWMISSVCHVLQPMNRKIINVHEKFVLAGQE